ncbi:MAG: 3-deoxy-D-arabinoheptulosonate-7-phosphate synthase [Polyangiaceae bacterium]|jgi:3-deoxy-7-phosphoheptulonate synthase|nr:3-deoxy-D-arabinoheptulosonate-7-phosphate synthase [Polyangiaceae bacterium]
MAVLTDDVRIDTLKPLLPPAILMEEIPLPDAASRAVAESRTAVARVIEGRDDRLVVVVGPCSIHDPEAGLEYARRLKPVMQKLSADLKIVMRTYFEKPRTTVGWKGLINDPKLDGSFAINQGLRVARTFLRDVVELGLPTALEFLDPITPQFMADLVTWGAIGARTTESQVHRELASGLSMPVGFKNGTGGTLQIAADAVRSAAEPHHFLSVTKQGLAAIVATKGNPHCHVILRGGSNGPNYGADAVASAVALLEKNGLAGKLMIDTSHANSGKDPARQPQVATAIAEQVAGGSRAIFGVMIESFLVAGRQEIRERSEMTFGQSVTDGCLSWDSTVPVLEELAESVRKRRG